MGRKGFGRLPSTTPTSLLRGCGMQGLLKRLPTSHTWTFGLDLLLQGPHYALWLGDHISGFIAKGPHRLKDYSTEHWLRDHVSNAMVKDQ